MDVRTAFNPTACISMLLVIVCMCQPVALQAQITAKITEMEKSSMIAGFDFGSKFASIRSGGYDPGLPQLTPVVILQNALNYGIARKKHQWVFALRFGIGTSARRRGAINLNFSEWGPTLTYARIIQLLPTYHIVPAIQVGLMSRSLSLAIDSTVQMKTRFSQFSSLHMHIEPGIYLTLPHPKNRKRPVRTSVYWGYSYDFSGRNFSVGGRRPRTNYGSTSASGFVITWNMQVFIP